MKKEKENNFKMNNFYESKKQEKNKKIKFPTNLWNCFLIFCEFFLLKNKISNKFLELFPYIL